jgi:hypothetical protein
VNRQLLSVLKSYWINNFGAKSTGWCLRRHAPDDTKATRCIHCLRAFYEEGSQQNNLQYLCCQTNDVRRVDDLHWEQSANVDYFRQYPAASLRWGKTLFGWRKSIQFKIVNWDKNWYCMQSALEAADSDT